MIIPATLPRVLETVASQRCPRCGHPTLIALVNGSVTRCDPQNLDTMSELLARIENRQTFDVLVYGLPLRLHLRWRGVTGIRAPRMHPVVADHQHSSDLVLRSGSPENTITDIVIPYANEKGCTDDPPF